MNRINRFLFGVAALALLAGCSDDIVNPDDTGGNGGGTDDGPGIYIGVNFSLPGMGQGTRSFTDGEDTSNNGTEVGKDYENNVNEVLLILARPEDNGLIASSIIPKQRIFRSSSSTDKIYQATAKFSENALDEFYANADKSITDPRDVHVFVFCNPNNGILSAVTGKAYGYTGWLDEGCKVTVSGQQTEGSIWSAGNGGNFLMNNVSIVTKKIPNSVDAWDNYTDDENCFHLSDVNGDDEGAINNTGAVKVERAAARFDFKDGSPLGERKYNVVYLRKKDTNELDETVPLVQVQLNKMALVNMSNQFYYLPRVSADGQPTDVTVCGAEKPWFTDDKGTLVTGSGNYVVSYYTGKSGYDIPLQSNFGAYFNYPFFNTDGTVNNNNVSSDRWGTVYIEDVLSGTPDEWGGTTENAVTKGTYRIWRYCTENTIPAGPDAADPGVHQKNGNSTGIVFKAKMLPCTVTGENEGLLDDHSKALLETLTRVNNTGNDVETVDAPMLFSWSGLFYSGWDNLYMAAIESAFSCTVSATDGSIIQHWQRDNSFYKAVFGTGGVGTFEWDDNGIKREIVDALPIDNSSVYGKYLAWSEAGNDNKNAALSAFKTAATDADFTLYEASMDNKDGWGYYCYYYYWNRHNDNGNPGKMGPMEFAVVRNNVYKLAVTKIKALGHPRISENDPDKPTPNTPDEETELYIDVECEVVPWVVRVNNIVFN